MKKHSGAFMNTSNKPDHPIIGLDLAQPIQATWVELARALAPLHRWVKADVDELHDIWLKGVPSPEYTVAVPGAVFDERRPRAGDKLIHIVPPLPVARWIEKLSAKRGFPFTMRQAFAITQGEVDLGF